MKGRNGQLPAVHVYSQCGARGAVFRDIVKWMFSTFEQYLDDRQGSNTNCFNYISARCARCTRCGISWHPSLYADKFTRLLYLLTLLVWAANMVGGDLVRPQVSDAVMVG